MKKFLLIIHTSRKESSSEAWDKCLDDTKIGTSGSIVETSGPAPIEAVEIPRMNLIPTIPHDMASTHG